MKYLNNILGYVGKGLLALVVTFVGLFVVVAIVVSVFTQSMEKGLGFSLQGTRYVVTFTGGCLSYADDLGSDLKRGKQMGDRALAGMPKP